LIQVHGGTTAEEIYKKVEEACRKAEEPKHKLIYTVLFFDEANATQAVGAIKEVICDRTINGEPYRWHPNLKIVVACNPYRK
jgi:hypothetical protein